MNPSPCTLRRVPGEKNDVNLRKLHSCRRTRDQILDLIFKEKTEPARSQFLAEVESCTGCFDHYLALSDTLRVFDDASTLAEPDENEWEEFEARLEGKLSSALGEPTFSIARLRRLSRSNVRIPIPIAAGVAICGFAAIVALAVRRPVTQVVTLPGELKIIERIVEVPVIQQSVPDVRIVTRKVFVDRKSPDAIAEAKLPEKSERVAQADSIDTAGSVTSGNLTGFQPPSDLKMRLLRRNTGDEK